jgi:hypothetical protein
MFGEDAASIVCLGEYSNVLTNAGPEGGLFGSQIRE